MGATTVQQQTARNSRQGNEAIHGNIVASNQNLWKPQDSAQQGLCWLQDTLIWKTRGAKPKPEAEMSKGCGGCTFSLTFSSVHGLCVLQLNPPS